ncbi:glycosyltransferase [Arthrobacter sp. zg-ZUI100]|uniref:glycosyltransferase family 2 protein n=1 Tax=Arthrobacter jiangjiafuii TaxID=2817475 RepID=UPI001AEEA40C|nr:glycosyltransferase family 2 protein [Arthrobacter jiangjiafuii]MBP3035619.1 glycosyltransferase [Arthrobacter jiangjiafuii]
MSRRWSGDWGAEPDGGVPTERGGTPLPVEVLIPTRERGAELAVTLAGLAAQEEPDFGVLVSDQSPAAASWEHPAAAAMVRVLRAQGRPVRLERNLPARGLAQQRAHLLEGSRAPMVLFLDDDVWLEPGLLRRLAGALAESGCGFVGSAVQGLSYLQDRRPDEEVSFEPWTGPVEPERIRRGDPGFERWPLHNAANLAHLAAPLELEPGSWLLYKVAWVGACVLFDRRKLLDCGGFSFWTDLPEGHSGEDVAAQWRVMERYGGAGLVPSGAVHLESPTTVRDRSTDAAELMFGQ